MKNSARFLLLMVAASTCGAALPNDIPAETRHPISELTPTAKIHLAKTADWVAITDDAVWVGTTGPTLSPGSIREPMPRLPRSRVDHDENVPLSATDGKTGKVLCQWVGLGGDSLGVSRDRHLAH